MKQPQESWGLGRPDVVSLDEGTACEARKVEVGLDPCRKSRAYHFVGTCEYWLGVVCGQAREQLHRTVRPEKVQAEILISMGLGLVKILTAVPNGRIAGVSRQAHAARSVNLVSRADESRRHCCSNMGKGEKTGRAAKKNNNNKQQRETRHWHWHWRQQLYSS